MSVISIFGWVPNFNQLIQSMRRIKLSHLIRLTIVAICLSLSSTIALAAEESAIKIGTMDWQQLFAKAPQAEAAGKRLEKEFLGPKEKLDNKQKEFITKRDKLQRDKDVMSAHERSRKEKELVKMEQDLRRMDEEFRSDQTSRHREEMDEFIKTVRDVVEKISQEEKYDLVLPQESTLYISERIDITEKILDRLEKDAKENKSDKKSDKSDKKSSSE